LGIWCVVAMVVDCVVGGWCVFGVVVVCCGRLP
jgi:hypothetical protein